MDKPLCVIPDCGRVAYSRGICRRCYLAAAASVRQRKTTWEWLESKGLALPLDWAGRRVSPFRRAFDATQPEESK